MGPHEEGEYRQQQADAGNPYIKIQDTGKPYADIITPATYTDRDLSGPPDTLNLYTAWLMSLGEQYIQEAAHTEQVSGMSNMEKVAWKKQQGKEGAEFGDNERYGWTIGKDDDSMWIQGGQGVDVQAWPISGYNPETSWADYFYSDDIESGQWAYPITEDGAKKWKIFEEGDTATIEADAHRHRAQIRIEKLRKAKEKDVRLMKPTSREDVRQNAMWSMNINLPPINKRDEAATVRDRIFK